MRPLTWKTYQDETDDNLYCSKRHFPATSCVQPTTKVQFIPFINTEYRIATCILHCRTYPVS